MAENAYVFFHPQYGGLRVVNNDGGLFFCLEDLVAITDIGRDTLFPVLADTEGKVVEMYVEVHTKRCQRILHIVCFSVNSLAILTRWCKKVE